MKYLLTILAAIVLVGCASDGPQTPVTQGAVIPEPPGPPETYEGGGTVRTNPWSWTVSTIVLTNPVVWVSGEVMHPGMVAWTQGLTLTNAIAQCGGFTRFAERRRLEIRRSFCGGTNKQTTNFPVFGLATNGIVLEGYDSVKVSRRIFW